MRVPAEKNAKTGRGLLDAAVFWVAFVLALVLVVVGPVLWVWPEASGRVVSAVFGGVPHAPTTAGEVRDLGGQLAGGAVVAFAVLLLERLAEGRSRRAEDRRREEDEERNFRLMLGLQKDLTGIDLAKRDLRSYFLRAKTLTDATLKGTNLAGADLTRCRLVNADLSGATLNATAFIDAEMHGARLIGAAAGSARMRGALLIDAVLDGANLRGAHLDGADLRRAWLRDPESLQKADLRGAKLLETRIVDAVFAGVNLEGADLEGAYLIGADLSGAINLGKAHLLNARYDDKTVWPKDFDPKSVKARPISENRDALLQTLYEEKKGWHVDATGTLRSS